MVWSSISMHVCVCVCVNAYLKDVVSKKEEEFHDWFSKSLSVESQQARPTESVTGKVMIKDTARRVKMRECLSLLECVGWVGRGR